MSTNTYGKELPPRPSHIERLPVDSRGYPVPYFASYFNGKPDFRVIDRDKVIAAAREGRCTICGGVLNGEAYFAVGPKPLILACATDGPSHKDCIEYAVKTCPFMLNPNGRARRSGLPSDPSVREQVEPQRPPIYCIVAARGEVKLDLSQIMMICTWDNADYRFWNDGRWLTPAEAKPYIDAALDEVHADIEANIKPIKLSEAQFAQWKTACRADATARAAKISDQIGAA